MASDIAFKLCLNQQCQKGYYFTVMDLIGIFKTIFSFDSALMPYIS